MPRQYVYTAINNPKRTFVGKDDYLDYLRVRHEERRVWRNITAYRDRCLARLMQVRECASIEDVMAFLNANARLFEPFEINHNITPENFRIARGGNSYWWKNEKGALWTGKIAYDYRERSTRQASFNSWQLRDAYDLPDRDHRMFGISRVLEIIGFKLGAGSGLSIGYASPEDRAIGNMGYNACLCASEFPVMVEAELQFAA